MLLLFRFLLQAAMTKAYVAAHKQQQLAAAYDRQLSGAASSSVVNASVEGSEYVVDIYCVQQAEGDVAMEVSSLCLHTISSITLCSY